VEPGGQLDMQQLLAAAAAMQRQLASAQQELADAEVSGSAGGDLVLAAYRDACRAVDELQDQTMAPFASGFGGGGFPGLPGMPGLPGTTPPAGGQGNASPPGDGESGEDQD
jgi:DNA-binding protein YbaB